MSGDTTLRSMLKHKKETDMQTTRLYFTSKYVGPTDKGSRYIVYDPYGGRHVVPFPYHGIPPEIESVLIVIGKLNAHRARNNQATIKVINHDKHSIPGIKNRDIHAIDVVYIKGE